MENSEKIEIIIRDKNQLNLVISDTTLERYVDYTFEPFSRALLFMGPIPSLDSNGNPESVRITYEVDQGGAEFWLLGASGEANLGSHLTLGGSVVDDRNPISPFRMESVNALAKIDAHTTLTVELAQTTSTSYGDNGQTYTNPTGAAGEVATEGTGQAERLQFTHTGTLFKFNVWALDADREFNNPTSGVTPGERELGARTSYDLSTDLQLHAEGIRTDDAVADASLTGALLGLDYRLSKKIKLTAGLRYSAENGVVGSQSFIGANPSPGSLYNPSGGFDGGVDPSQVNPLTGQAITHNVSPLTPGQAGPELDGTFAFAGAEFKPLARLTLNGQVEEDISGDGSSPLRNRQRLAARRAHQALCARGR